MRLDEPFIGQAHMKAEVKEIIDGYPSYIRPLIFQLRAIVFSVAKDQNLGDIQETLSWREPSYQIKSGSPIKIAWITQSPSQYYLFF
jgi:hypothetical protein